MMSRFPQSFSSVEVKWQDAGVERDMSFNGGVVGVSYSKETGFRPEVGWCVSELTK